MAHSQTLKKTVFLDRDGVLNELVDRGDAFVVHGQNIRWTAPFNLGELRFKPMVRPALALMARKGYRLVVVTNQPNIRTGHMTQQDFDAIMDEFRRLPLDAIYACPHLPADGCACRKPKPGMLLGVRDVDMTRSYMIGDLETDVAAGKAAGARTIRICDPTEITAADHRVNDVMEAALLLP